MKSIFRKFMKNWCLKNFPLEETTIVKERKITTIYVKKGKIRQWRSYEKGKRIAVTGNYFVKD